MQDLIVVGGGGFFLELSGYLRTDIKSEVLTGCRLRGFLDDDSNATIDDCVHLGSIRDYTVKSNDLFLIAVGDVHHRDRIYRQLIEKGASFFTYIHPSAFVSDTAVLSDGVIVCPNSIINAKATVSSNTLINVGCSIGHEATVGASCTLSPGSIINGAAILGSTSFMGTCSIIFPGVSVGEKSVIDTHSYVKWDVESSSIVSLRAEYTVVKNRLVR